MCYKAPPKARAQCSSVKMLPLLIKLLALSVATILSVSATPFNPQDHEARWGGKVKPKVFIISMVSCRSNLTTKTKQLTGDITVRT